MDAYQNFPIRPLTPLETVLGPFPDRDDLELADAQSYPRVSGEMADPVYKITRLGSRTPTQGDRGPIRYCVQPRLLGTNMWRLITDVTLTYELGAMVGDGRPAYIFEPWPGLHRSGLEEFKAKVKAVDEFKYDWYPYKRDILEFKPGRRLSLPECCNKMGESALHQLENGSEVAVLHFAQKRVHEESVFDTASRTIMYQWVFIVEKV